MTRMTLLGALLFLCGSATQAEPDQAILDKLSPAWLRLDTLSQEYLTPEQQKTLYELAYATVVSEICPGFELNRDKFLGGFQGFNGEKRQHLPAEEQRDYDRKLLVLYGTATGLLSAEGQLTMDRFCTAARAVRDGSESTYWK